MKTGLRSEVLTGFEPDFGYIGGLGLAYPSRAPGWVEDAFRYVVHAWGLK
jgi:hypothetical protein